MKSFANKIYNCLFFSALRKLAGLETLYHSE